MCRIAIPNKAAQYPGKGSRYRSGPRLPFAHFYHRRNYNFFRRPTRHFFFKKKGCPNVVQIPKKSLKKRDLPIQTL